MRIKAIRGLLAATIAASTVAVVGVGVSSPASAASCSTWQYQVTSKTGGWSQSSEGELTPTVTLYTGYLVNSRIPQDIFVPVSDADGTHQSLMKFGRIYRSHTEPLFGEYRFYVRKDKLDYVTCW
jgi:hypothetical protein